MKVEALITQLCSILCSPIDCSPPGSSVHGILQARTLEWVAMLSSRGFSQPRDWTQVSCIGEQSHLEALTRFRWLKKKNVIFTELPATDSPSQASTEHEPWTSRCSRWITKGRGTRDQIANICCIIKIARELKNNIYLCFTLSCGVGEDSWESLGLQGDPTSPFWKRSALGFLWKEWC